MANPHINQEDFIDLYDALDLPQNADVGKLRKRINALYLESQQNLDHRNPRKRLNYQQLYEIILPQAKHLLLDEGRRGEYDRYLTAFKTGTKVSAAQETESRIASTFKPTTVTERLKEEEGVDPEKLAEKREDMWAQWKQGLEQIEDKSEAAEAPIQTDSGAPKANIPGSPTPAPRAAAPPQTRGPELRRANVAPGESDTALTQPGGFSEVALHSGGSPRLSADERRQQEQRRAKTIKKRATAAMFPRGMMVGVPVFLVCCAVLYYATNYLTSAGYLIDWYGEAINLGWPLLAAVIGFISGRNAAESARDATIEKLSSLTFDELKKK